MSKLLPSTTPATTITVLGPDGLAAGRKSQKISPELVGVPAAGRGQEPDGRPNQDCSRKVKKGAKMSKKNEQKHTKRFKAYLSKGTHLPPNNPPTSGIFIRPGPPPPPSRRWLIFFALSPHIPPPRQSFWDPLQAPKT